MSEKCEHRHDDCNRRHGCGGGCGYGGYGGYAGGYGGYCC